jgi:cytosine permease
MAQAIRETVSVTALPAYLRNAMPIPVDKRAAWYTNTAPTYAGIFLWFAFYQPLGSALREGTLLSVLLGIIVAGAICHFFFYYVPGMLGMRTGLPLYIVGTSTFGVQGGYFIPGIFMGLLQIGWYSVATYFATRLVLGGLGLPTEGTLFYVLAPIWGFVFALVGALGIGYVAKISQFFPVVPIVMLLIGAVQALPYLGQYQPPPATGEHTFDTDLISAGSLLVIQMIVGFFGTAGAVGADFCANNRHARDVQYAGLTGIWGAILFAAGLGVITVAGAHGYNPSLRDLQEIEDGKLVTKKKWDEMNSTEKDQRLTYETALKALNTTVAEDGTVQENLLARGMLLLFAIGSMAPACFCSFIIGNSLSTMLGMPRSRIPITLAGAAVGILIALTGLPANLAPIFGLVGASFGPVIGAMIADYFLNGGNWPGPREGINWAGYGAWLVGFLIGISNNSLIAQGLGFELVPAWHPTGVYSLIAGLVVYIVLARVLGLPARLEGAVKVVDPDPRPV